MTQWTEETGQENRKKQKEESSKSSSTMMLIIKHGDDKSSRRQLSLRASEPRSLRALDLETQSGEESSRW